MNKTVFGTTMESMKHYMEMKLTTKEKMAIQYVNKNTFKSARNIDGFYIVEFYTKETLDNKPIYVGTSILDLSKLTMMKFHYDVIHRSFEGRYNLIYSDTDSLVYNIQHDNIYQWIKETRHMLTSPIRSEVI